MRGSDPPRCSAHGGGKHPVGAPIGNANALKHGVYTSPPPAETGAQASDSQPPDLWPPDNGAAQLAARIADLNRRADQLAAYIDQLTVGPRSPNGGDGTGGTVTVQEYGKLVALQGQLCSRIGRLLRDLKQLQGSQNDELQQMIYEALDQASEILGVKL